MTLPMKGAVANSVVEECESTNDLVRQLAESGSPHGTWVSARRQLAGRGRLGRKWETIEGNLFLSILARMAPSSTWSWIPMATAVAVAECLRDFNPKLQVEIKWPNDLWLDRKKLGGILCEATGNKTESFVVIGLGRNCLRAPEGLDQATISLTEFLSLSAGAYEVTADEIRQPLITAILSILEDLTREGASGFLSRYERFAALKSGTAIEWKSGVLVSHGEVQGMGVSGELLVRTPAGVQKLFAEDVKVRAIF